MCRCSDARRKISLSLPPHPFFFFLAPHSLAHSTRYSAGWLEESVELMRGYDFVIAFENSKREGYITEKVTGRVRSMVVMYMTCV